MKNNAGQEMAKLRWSKPEAHKKHSEKMKSFWTEEMRELARERARLLWTPEKCAKHAKLIQTTWDKRNINKSKIEKIKIIKSKKEKEIKKYLHKKIEGRERTRELIRIRDNYTCQICGKVWIEGQRRFDVHHKDCVKEKTKQYDKYEIEKDNLITLCHKCHLNLPEHRFSMNLKELYPQDNLAKIS
jgi:5-methylcytosine-specific restriction endonuclease McrA